MRRINVRALPEPIPFEMGLQVSCRVCAETAKESDLWTDPPSPRADFPWAGAAEGMPDPGRTSDAGPCTHVHRHPTEAPGSIGDRISQRQECNCHCSPLRQGAKFLG